MPAIIDAALGLATALGVGLLILKRPRAARWIAFGLAAVGAVLFLILIGSGVGRDPGTPSPLHRWTAHAFVILVWNGTLISIGVALGEARRGPAIAAARSLALLALLGVVVLAAMTGSMLPDDPDVGETTLDRFRVLHGRAFPTAVGALGLCWLWIARPRRASASAEGVDRPGAAACPAEGHHR